MAGYEMLPAINASNNQDSYNQVRIQGGNLWKSPTTASCEYLQDGDTTDSPGTCSST